MNYQEARRVRKTGLLSLINEGLFDEGKGIGGAVGGAISKRFKAKSVGIQEALDPLNWVRKLTGQGAVGDLAVTGLGRLFGRSNSAITAFGGYGRKNKKKKKNPQRTTVGARQIKPLKVGDSSADILGKMYNFMQKTHEIYKLNYQIEDAFRQEQMDEDERRHKKLIEAILNKKIKPADDKGVKSFIDKLLEGIKKTLAFLMKPITMVLSLIKDIGLMVGSAILGAMTSLTTFLVGSVLSIITPAIDYLAGLSVKRALTGIANSIPPPFGTALKIGVAAWFGAQTENLERKLLQNLMPEDVAKATEKGSGSDYDKAREDYARNVSQFGVDSGPAKAAKKNFDAEKDKLQEKLDKNFKENIEPIAKAAGYTIDYDYRDNHLGLAGGLNLPTVFNKDREQVLPEGLALLTAGVKQADGVLDILKGDTKSLEKKLKIDEFQGAVEKKIDAVRKDIKTQFDMPKQTNVPEQIDPQQFDKQSLSPGEEIISNTQINNIKGNKPKQVSLNTPNPRNSDLQSYLKHTSAYV